MRSATDMESLGACNVQDPQPPRSKPLAEITLSLDPAPEGDTHRFRGCRIDWSVSSRVHDANWSDRCLAAGQKSYIQARGERPRASEAWVKASLK
jgi:hypothetical protein